MHTMVVQMSIDPSRTDVVTRHLREDIVSWARQQPGFVSGQWLVGPRQDHGMGVVVFASEDAATALNPAACAPATPLRADLQISLPPAQPSPAPARPRPGPARPPEHNPGTGGVPSDMNEQKG
jgi:hypothetical protein